MLCLLEAAEREDQQVRDRVVRWVMGEALARTQESIRVCVCVRERSLFVSEREIHVPRVVV